MNLTIFKIGLSQWRIAAVVYLIQGCLALTLGMQVYHVLEASIGNSLEINKLMQGYDHTVIMDFLKVHGASITPLIGQLRWLLLVWLIFSVFVNAGLLYCAAPPESTSPQRFWQGGAVFFFPFLKISLAFLVLLLVWSVVVFLPLAIFLEPALHYFSSEKYVVGLVLMALAVWLKGLVLIYIWSILSRAHRLNTTDGTFRSIKEGWQQFYGRKVHYLSRLALFGAVQILLILSYYTLESWAGMTTPARVGCFFVLQQWFVFIRIQLRQMVYTALVK